MLTITPLYAGLLGLLFVWLSANVIRVRLKHGISVGDHGNKDMIKVMRVQANFSDYVPLTLLLIAMAELQSAPHWLVHVLGLMLLAGRVLHVIGFGRTPQIIPLRQGGMILTLLSLIAASLTCLVMAF